jgi:hypothetical protein
MQARQLITGLVLALAAFFIYQWVLSFVFPPRPLAPATQPAAGTPATGPAPAVRAAFDACHQ